MYGPSIGILITNDLSLSVSYPYGNLSSRYEDIWEAEVYGRIERYDSTGYVSIERHDVDCAISYRITGAFRIFAGYKYQPSTLLIKRKAMVWDYSDSTKDRIINEEADIDITYQGPALGAGISLPFADIFAFTANLSVLYVVGKGETDIKEVKYFANDFRTGEPDKFLFIALSILQGSSPFHAPIWS